MRSIRAGAAGRGALPRAATSPAVALAVVAFGVLWRRMAPDDPGRHLAAAPQEPRPLRDLAGWVPAAPRGAPGRLAAYAWASPLTLAGVLVGLATGARPTVHRGVLVFAGIRGPVRALLRRRGFTATTLGHVVIAAPSAPSAALLAHELVHTRQAERLGVAFGPLYVALLGRYGYHQHPLERAARAGAADAGHTDAPQG